MSTMTELKPGDFLVCLDPAEPLGVKQPGYDGLIRGQGYTVRSVPKPRYVSLMETAPEVLWQQSRFEKVSGMHKRYCTCPDGKNLCLLPPHDLRSGVILETRLKHTRLQMLRARFGLWLRRNR